MGSAAEPTAGSERWIFWTAAALVVVLDLITKIIAEATLLRTPGIAVLGDWFQLRLVYNQGAAFGLHLGPYSRWIFLTVAIVGFDGIDETVGFWMSRGQYEVWSHTRLIVDVVPGRGGGFSLEAPEGVRFLIRSRVVEAEPPPGR